MYTTQKLQAPIMAASRSPYFDETATNLLLEIATVFSELWEIRRQSAVRQQEIKREHELRRQQILQEHQIWRQQFLDQRESWRQEHVVMDIQHLFSKSSWSLTDDEVLVDVHHLFDEISEPIGSAMTTPALLPLSVDIVAATKKIFGPLTKHDALLAAETPNPSPFIGLVLENSWQQLLLKVFSSLDLPKFDDRLYLSPPALSFIKQILACHMLDQIPVRSVTSLSAMAFWPTGIGTCHMFFLPSWGTEGFPFVGGGFFRPFALSACLDFASYVLKWSKFKLGYEQFFVIGDEHHLFDEMPLRIVDTVTVIAFWSTGIGTQFQVLLWHHLRASGFPFDGGGSLNSNEHLTSLGFVRTVINMMQYEHGWE